MDSASCHLSITLVGIDGAGKSTQCHLLRDALQDLGLNSFIHDRWGVLNRSRFPECRFLVNDLSQLKQCVGEVSGTGRALLLFMLQAIALEKSENQACSEIEIFDGYWCKHAATELALGCPTVLIDALISIFPPTHMTFFLDIDPEVAVHRKAREGLNAYECGLDHSLSSGSFLFHQGKVRTILSRWADQYAWERIDASQHQSTIASQILHSVIARV